MAKDFTVGEYKMRNGGIAVIFGVVPGDCGQPLVGYRMHKGLPTPAAWCIDGRHGTYGAFPQFDLMPNKKRIESWGFVYWNLGGRLHVDDDNEKSAKALRNHFANVLGYSCSEVFKYPTLEVEE